MVRPLRGRRPTIKRNNRSGFPPVLLVTTYYVEVPDIPIFDGSPSASPTDTPDVERWKHWPEPNLGVSLGEKASFFDSTQSGESAQMTSECPGPTPYGIIHIPGHFPDKIVTELAPYTGRI